MGPDRLAELGLTVHEGAAGPEVVLPLQGSVVNPLTGRRLGAVTLAVAEELLIPVDPPELVGLPPLVVDGVTELAALEAQLIAGLRASTWGGFRPWPARSRRWALSPCIELGSLEVRAETELEGLRISLGGDKQGKLRILAVHRAGALLRTDVGAPFEVPEVPDAASFQAQLLALVGETPAPRRDVGYGELPERFGPAARVPATSPLELVTDFTVRGERYRFVAARIRGRTFRGLLAGPDGKKWAEHFELEDFTGVADVASRVLGIAARGDLVASRRSRGERLARGAGARRGCARRQPAHAPDRRRRPRRPPGTSRRCSPGTGRAYVVGITGSPGAGKSTLTDRLVARLRAEGKIGRRPRGGPDQPLQRGRDPRRPHPDAGPCAQTRESSSARWRRGARWVGCPAPPATASG